MVSSVPPNARNMSCINISVIRDTTPEMSIVSVNELPNIFSAFCTSFCPMVMETLAAAPAPINMPNAINKIMKGNVSANPEMASGPTPCPMKILSTILYNDITTVPIMEGMEYCQISLPRFSVPRVVAGDDVMFNVVVCRRKFTYYFIATKYENVFYS